MTKTRVGLVGSGFVADLHAAAFQMVPDAEVVAVASPAPGKARHFAQERGIPQAFEKAATTKGYTFTMFEEIWNDGFP